VTATSVRSVLRIGWRTARRHTRRTALIAALIGIAVLIAVGAAIAIRTTTPTRAETVAGKFGAAAMEVELTGYSDAAASWVENELATLVPEADTAQILRAYLPFAELIGADLTDPIFDGKFSIVAGRPPGAGEVALSWRYARSAELSVGDAWTPPGSASTYPVTATFVEMGEKGGSPSVLATGEGFAQVLAATTTGTDDPYRVTTWLVRGNAGDPAIADRINDDWDRAGGSSGGLRGELVPYVSAQHRFYWEQPDFPLGDPLTGRPSLISAVVAALLLAEVALLASAAYATGIRRRLREIGLIITQGATRGQIRATVIGEAAVTASIGAAVGAAAAIGIATAIRPFIQSRFDPTITAMQIAPADVVGPVAGAVVAAAIAAWLPARTASRVPVLTALHGRMPVGRIPRWLVPLSAGLVASGAFLILVVRSSGGGLGQVQATIGVVLVIAGGILIGAPLVSLLGRIAHRLPLVARLAVRDTVRQSVRATAAIAALMVVLVGAVAAATALAGVETVKATTGSPNDGGDPRLAYARGDYTDRLGIGGEPEIESLPPEAEAEITALLPRAATFDVEEIAGTPVLSAFAPGVRRSDAVYDSYYCVTSRSGTESCYSLDAITLKPAITTPAALVAIGAPDAAEALAAGRPVLLGNADEMASVDYDGEKLEVQMYAAASLPQPVPRLYVPESWAASRGFTTATRRSVLFVNDTPLTGTQRQALWATDVNVTVGLAGVGIDAGETMMLIVAAATLVVALVITVVVALSATESDRDVATMVAVGAAPSMRRRFLGRQSALYVASAALIAAPLGALLMAVASDQRARVGPFGTWDSGITVPWIAIVGLVVVAPIVVGFGAMSLTRSLPARPPRRVG
jgi:putative ABC transport system permease protein